MIPFFDPIGDPRWDVVVLGLLFMPGFAVMFWLRDKWAMRPYRCPRCRSRAFHDRRMEYRDTNDIHWHATCSRCGAQLERVNGAHQYRLHKEAT